MIIVKDKKEATWVRPLQRQEKDTISNTHLSTATQQLVLEDLAVVYFFLYLLPGRAQGGVHVCVCVYVRAHARMHAHTHACVNMQCV